MFNTTQRQTTPINSLTLFSNELIHILISATTSSDITQLLLISWVFELPPTTCSSIFTLPLTFSSFFTYPQHFNHNRALQKLTLLFCFPLRSELEQDPQDTQLAGFITKEVEKMTTKLGILHFLMLVA